MDEGLELSLAAHSTRGVTLCLTAYARLAFVEGDPQRAALLAGAVDGLRRRVGLRPWPLLRRGGAGRPGPGRTGIGSTSRTRPAPASASRKRWQPSAPAPKADPPRPRGAEDGGGIMGGWR
jgi:hypothetical protein